MTAENQPKKKKKVSLCVGCGSPIFDQFILRVAPDLEWHASCLKCADCNQYLDESCTCFVRDGKTYCKRDYVRLFGTKCSKCSHGFCKSDFVMRAKNKIYHIDCFRCTACSRQLIPGDEFALREDGLFCKADHDVVERLSANQNGVDSKNNNNNNQTPNNNTNGIDRISPGLQTAGQAEKVSGPKSGRPHMHKSDHKTTRIRTVLNEKQLHTLRTCYGANPRPDALMKEQLTEMTGLSPRVIRVWFQNKRCKDKKRSILMKQVQQQHDKGGGRMQGPLQGVPMVASSPVRHDSQMQPNAVEVQSYQPPWKALSEFAMQNELDQPPFQQLMNSFDNMSDSNDGMNHPHHLEMMHNPYLHSPPSNEVLLRHSNSVSSDFSNSELSSPISQ